MAQSGVPILYLRLNPGFWAVRGAEPAPLGTGGSARLISVGEVGHPSGVTPPIPCLVQAFG